MAEPLVDVDLDALAPRPKRTRLAGKMYLLPGDMPMELFLRIQSFEQRVEKGEAEAALLEELAGEVLTLFQVHQPQLKKLPAETGVLTLLGALGAIYGGGPGEAPPKTPTRPARKKTPSPKTRPARRATSR